MRLGGIPFADLRRIVVPTLDAIGLGGEQASLQVLGTAYVEGWVDGDMHLFQQGAGPALSPWQIEPATARDILGRYLGAQGNQSLFGAVRSLMPVRYVLEDELAGNLRLAAAVARIKYRMAKPPLPAANDPGGQAQYHKDYYNTAGGAASVAVNTPKFAAVIAAWKAA